MPELGEAKIVINARELSRLNNQSMKIVDIMSHIQGHARGIAEGKLTGFYKGEAEGAIVQYYVMLAQNLGVLTQQYSKLGEYIMVLQESMEMADAAISKSFNLK